jgi:hypothetical protein
VRGGDGAVSAHRDGHVILAWGIDAAGTGGKRRACRRDGTGEVLNAAMATELNVMIRAEVERAVAAR